MNGEWKFNLTFFEPEKGFILLVNGDNIEYEYVENTIAFTGEGGCNAPLCCKIVY